MKKLWKLFTMTLLGLVISGATGCQKEKPSTPDATIKKATEVAPAATQVPKDHPAH